MRDSASGQAGGLTRAQPNGRYQAPVPRPLLLLLPPRRAAPAMALALGVVLPILATVLLPIATLPPFWTGAGPLAFSALALTLVAAAGAIGLLVAQALVTRDIACCAFRGALLAALLSPTGASLAVPALLGLFWLRRPRVRCAANDNAPAPRAAVWVVVTPERAVLALDQSVA